MHLWGAYIGAAPHSSLKLTQPHRSHCIVGRDVAMCGLILHCRSESAIMACSHPSAILAYLLPSWLGSMTKVHAQGICISYIFDAEKGHLLKLPQFALESEHSPPAPTPYWQQQSAYS